MLNAMDLGYRLHHASRGDGRQRTLVVTKVGQSGHDLAAKPNLSGLDLPPSGGIFSPCAAGPGQKLGGRMSTDGKREASAMAAERRMSAASTRGLKKPRISQPSTMPQKNASHMAPRPASSSSSSSSDSDSDMDEEMKRAMEASLQEVLKSRPHNQEDKDLEEALRLSTEEAAPPARFARLSASTSILVAEKLRDTHPLRLQSFCWPTLVPRGLSSHTSNFICRVRDLARRELE